MNCRQAADLIHRRMDGELHRAEQLELEAHLLSCPACRELEARMSRLGNALTALARANDAALQSEAPAPGSRPPRTARGLGRWALAGLAAAACVGFILLTPSTIRREPALTQPPLLEAADTPRRPVVRLAGESRKKFLAAEVDTGVENVRLVYVFPVATRTAGSATQPAS
jgi:anti-sigma factor RsiW